MLSKRDELRFEYAWRWFALHAQQRVAMFNFFLIASGILANAYVLLVREKLYDAAGLLAIVAAVISVAFVFLDRRNRQLVHIGEDQLVGLEKSVLGTREAFVPGAASLRGLLIRESVEGEPRFYLKHWFLFEGVEVLFCGGFVAAAIWAFVC